MVVVSLMWSMGRNPRARAAAAAATAGSLNDDHCRVSSSFLTSSARRDHRHLVEMEISSARAENNERQVAQALLETT
ncbi:unnamed protein product [Heligmosomoides polygyrus]|uniref:Secreted protein n=1 Tax=Heligmosomoides polygyrus TaxID=6339 RepID=A0A183FUP3_HELPZ|nr:unnamed protein product [Heligmosomoides polygyrus]